MDPLFLARLVESLLTLYMLLILLRWLGRFIGFDLEEGWWKGLTKLTDPLIQGMRRVLPNMGPVDFGPIAALFVVWLVRILVVGALYNSATDVRL